MTEQELANLLNESRRQVDKATFVAVAPLLRRPGLTLAPDYNPASDTCSAIQQLDATLQSIESRLARMKGSRPTHLQLVGRDATRGSACDG